jgi:hypothetical protein
MSDSSNDIPTHPEEIKTTYDLRIGKSISLQGSARITPAGIATASICILTVSLVLMAARRRWY